MKLGVLLLLLAGIAAAQTQGFAPQPVDSYLDGFQMNGGAGTCAGSQTCVNFNEGVSSTENDLIVCVAQQQDANLTGCKTGGGGNAPWTFSDSLSDTWTNADNGDSFGGQYMQEMSYACVGSNSSTYTVNVTGNAVGCAFGLICTRFKNACSSGSVTKDAFQSTVNVIGSSSAFTTNTATVTTTKLRDLLVSAAGVAPGNGGSNRWHIGGGMGATGSGGTGNANGMGWQIAGTLGSNTTTFYDMFVAHNSDINQTIAFSVPINIGDSILPQGAVGVSYSAQLHCYGGTSASPTYALSSGSLNGLTLHTATGVIDGTPSAAGTFTPAFTCTDGSSTSSARTLILVTQSSFIAPSEINTQITNFNAVPSTVTFNSVLCGDVITLSPAGVDTHGSTGYMQTINGTNNKVTASDGSPVQQYFINGGTGRAPNVVWVVGPITASGTITITTTNNTSASSGLVVNVTQWRGVQAVIDAAVANSSGLSGNANNGSLSTNYTTVVPNEMLLATTFAAHGTPGTSGPFTFSFNAPFTLLNNTTGGVFGDGGYAYGLISSATTTTETTTITGYSASGGGCNGSNWCDAWTTVLTALRPGSAPCGLTPQFEKIRRYVN